MIFVSDNSVVASFFQGNIANLLFRFKSKACKTFRLKEYTMWLGLSVSLCLVYFFNMDASRIG